MATILVVDDEIGIRELLSEILGDEGHAVLLAENAGQARALRDQEQPDLVLLDIWMPDTDGVTLLKEWSVKGLLTMPVIMMSGHATIDTAVEATRIGALDFLEKPISLQKLLGAVEKGLARGKMVQSARALMQSQPKSNGASGLSSNAGGAPAAAPGAMAATPDSSPLGQALAELSTLDLDAQLRDARDSFERIYFEYHLRLENGSMTRLAERTGIERTHLYRKLKQLGVEVGRTARKNIA
ncbi:MAG: response regulator [Pseudomonadota bacterium]|jgi:DNA-binding NtrC family response regulator|uniref:response regulator n=1 Tax=Limnobacter alexandrii TaxID=2570352 RepID=UPI0011083D88|nr:response regulator [Limnobacter alexandrii]